MKVLTVVELITQAVVPRQPSREEVAVVVTKPRRLLEEQAVVAVTTACNFPLLDKDARRRYRLNPQIELPDDFSLCLNPACRVALPDSWGSEDWVECPICTFGYDPQELSERMQKPGGVTKSTLPPTDQGRLAERALEAHGDFGVLGCVNWWNHEPSGPLDGTTDAGWGIEVKSASSRAGVVQYIGGTVEAKRRKNDEIQRLQLRGVMQVLAYLDFELSLQFNFLRVSAVMGSYQLRRGETPWLVIPFENPFSAQPELKIEPATEEEPIPF